MNEIETYCTLAKTLLDTETKIKNLIVEIVTECMPKGYEFSHILKLDTIALTYRAVFCEKYNSDKIIHCDFIYKDKQVIVQTACVNMFNTFYVYPDKPYALKDSNADEIFPYDKARLKETFKVFDSLKH